MEALPTELSLGFKFCAINKTLLLFHINEEFLQKLIGSFLFFFSVISFALHAGT
jgi:hypothetical protein